MRNQNFPTISSLSQQIMVVCICDTIKNAGEIQRLGLAEIWTNSMMSTRQGSRTPEALAVIVKQPSDIIGIVTGI